MFLKRLVLILLVTLAPIAALASSEAAHPVSPEMGLQMLAEAVRQRRLKLSDEP